jgi:hypothetical protein
MYDNILYGYGRAKVPIRGKLKQAKESLAAVQARLERFEQQEQQDGDEYKELSQQLEVYEKRNARLHRTLDKLATKAEQRKSALPWKPMPPEKSLNAVMKLNADVRCGGCGLQREDVPREFKLCARCRTIRYCPKRCQKQDWKQHKTVRVDKFAARVDIDAIDVLLNISVASAKRSWW